MQIKVTLEEKLKLHKYYTIMNDDSLSLSQRRVARLMFDELYYELLKR